MKTAFIIMILAIVMLIVYLTFKRRKQESLTFGERFPNLQPVQNTVDNPVLRTVAVNNLVNDTVATKLSPQTQQVISILKSDPSKQVFDSLGKPVLIERYRAEDITLDSGGNLRVQGR